MANDLPKQSNWIRPIPHDDPVIDRLTAMIAALTSELTMVRERLDTVERLAEKAGVLTQAAVDGYIPEVEAAKARDAMRQRQISKVFRPLQEDIERQAKSAAALTRSA